MISQVLPNDFTGAEVTRLILIPDSTNHLTPALSPNFVGGEGGTFTVFPENFGLDCLCGHPPKSSFTATGPLPGERKQVRASVSTNFIFC